MGCGCGGSNRQAAQTRQAAQRRDGGSTREKAEPRVMDGFTWNGPQRAEPKPKTA